MTETNLTEAQFKRLPVYAKTEIERLLRRITTLEARQAEGPADSRVFVWRGVDDPTPIGHDPVVEFYTQGGPNDDTTRGRWGHRFMVKIENEGCIEIVGGDSLAVYPRSGNVVRISTSRAP